MMSFLLQDLNVFDGIENSVKYKVKNIYTKAGSHLYKGKRICELINESENGSVTIKARFGGVVSKVFISVGDEAFLGDSLIEIKACSHPTILGNICCDCGVVLEENSTQAEETKSHGLVSMLHSIPDLKVSKEEATRVGNEDIKHLLDKRKLVLLVDLDQTLIHTTNDNIPPKLKDVFHFQLITNGPWYHTRLRPFTFEFLKNISKLYELHICTFGVREYAHCIAHFLDPDHKLFGDRILSRNECLDPMSKKANLSSLFPCGDNLVCIIDDRSDVWNFAPNVVQVMPYHFFQHTGDINAPPGLQKIENDNISMGYDFSNLEELTATSGKRRNSKSESKKDNEVEDLSKKDLLEDKEKDLSEKSNKQEEEEDEVKSEETSENDSKSLIQSNTNKDVTINVEEETKEQNNKEEDDTKVDDNKEEEDDTKIDDNKKDDNKKDDNKKDDNKDDDTKVDDNKEDDTKIENNKEDDTKIDDNKKDDNKDDDTKVDDTKIENNKEDDNKEDDDTKTENNKEEDNTKVDDNKEGETKIEDNKVSETENVKEVVDDNCASELKEENNEVEDDHLTTKSTDSQNESETIDVEDSDDYLLYLEDILKTLHAQFYEAYDPSLFIKNNVLPDLKEIVPSARKTVLQGCHLVLSGIVPQHTELKESKAYHIATSLGASVSDKILVKSKKESNSHTLNYTTHVIAANLHTEKVHLAKKLKTVKIVTPNWLWCCAERWERVDERLFKLTADSEITIVRNPPMHCFINLIDASPNNLKHDDDFEYFPTSESTPSSDVVDVEGKSLLGSLNPLAFMSNDEAKSMEDEVDDILHSDEDDDQVEYNSKKRELESSDSEEDSALDTSVKESNEEEEEDDDVRRKRKRRRTHDDGDEDDDDEDDDDDDDELPSIRFRQGEALPSDENDGDSGDDDMNAYGDILERELMRE